MQRDFAYSKVDRSDFYVNGLLTGTETYNDSTYDSKSDESGNFDFSMFQYHEVVFKPS